MPYRYQSQPSPLLLPVQDAPALLLLPVSRHAQTCLPEQVVPHEARLLQQLGAGQGCRQQPLLFLLRHFLEGSKQEVYTQGCLTILMDLGSLACAQPMALTDAQGCEDWNREMSNEQGYHCQPFEVNARES